MTEHNLSASVRRNMAKSYRKDLLSRGMVPAVVYGKTVGNVPLEIGLKDLERALHSGKNTIINLAVSGNGGPYKVMVKDLQYDPLRKGLIHADFQQISLKDRINTSVDVVLTGEAEGGLARVVMRSLDISCLPTNIPDNITVDVSGMSPGGSITVGDLDIPEGIRVLAEPDVTVVTVMAPDREVPVAAEAGNADAEGDADLNTGNK
ncbi:MAG: 50S ribosomal protein L25 [Bacillota bacterium]